MKVGIFTDPHYSSHEVTCGNRYNSRSLKKIAQAYEVFQAQGCELVICLGDLTDKEESHEREIQNLNELAAFFQTKEIPFICVMGNHDAFSFPKEEFYRLLGGYEPKNTVIGGKKLVFLDACYFRSGKRYGPGDSDWTDTFLPDARALEELLKDPCKTYIFMHQNIDPEIRHDHRLYNADELLRIIEQSGHVKTVYQGHYHWGHKTHHNGVEYVTFPAMCENENCWFVVDL